MMLDSRSAAADDPPAKEEEEAPVTEMAASSSPSVAVSLFTPYIMGRFKLSHRVVLAPMTRCRCFDNIPRQNVRTYYFQRASIGGLLISESLGVSDTALEYPYTPGIWKREQVVAWKPVVRAVRKKGGIFFCQLSHAGRASSYDLQPYRRPPISCTNKKITSLFHGKFWPYPRRLKTDQIPEIVNQFRLAARNAMDAGFDGVEIHGSDGHLIEQFMKDSANDRKDDEYGGSIENRCRFALEIVKAVAKEIGNDRVGMKIAPFECSHDCFDSNPESLALYMANALNELNIRYLHVIQSTRMRKWQTGRVPAISLMPMRNAFKNTFIVGNGFDKKKGNRAMAENYADLVAFGRLFLENPDLPRRLKLCAHLNKPDPDSYYTHELIRGYIDFPFLNT